METKIVKELGTIKEVPWHYRKCSVCGKWVDPSGDQFSSHPSNTTDHPIQTRTNCKECYCLPLGEFIEKEEKMKKFFKSPEYQEASRKAEFYRTVVEKSISVKDFIETLQKLPPNARICFTNQEEGSDEVFSPADAKLVQQYISEKEKIPFYSLDLVL
jgi:hypothetical protein